MSKFVLCDNPKLDVETLREKPKIVAGIPAFDEELAIAKVVVHSSRYVDKVLVIDDGSHDDTGLIAEKLGAQVIRNERNQGKGTALRTCLEWAKEVDADVLVTLDGDGQHNPEEIPMVVDPILKGKADVVVGSRRLSSQDKAYRRFGRRLLDRVTDVKVNGVLVDTQSGFRAYSRMALEKVKAAESGMGVDSEILMMAKEAQLKIVQVPITARYDLPNSSTHHALYHGFDVFFSIIKFMSIRHPFLFYGGFSAIMFVVAIVFGVQTLDFYAREGHVATNPALVSVSAGILAFLSFFTGVILFTLITVLREKR